MFGTTCYFINFLWEAAIYIHRLSSPPPPAHTHWGVREIGYIGYSYVGTPTLHPEWAWLDRLVLCIGLHTDPAHLRY